MKTTLLAALTALSFTSYALPSGKMGEMVVQQPGVEKNRLVKHYNNLQSLLTTNTFQDRTIDFPTQIVRIEAAIQEPERSCESVQDEIYDFFTSHILSNQFYYNTLTFCQYDPDTHFAVRFGIDSYFDPMNDEAVDTLNNYLSEHNGKLLLGAPFEVESAKELVVSLNIDAGEIEGDYDDVFVRYRHDNNTLYYANHYQFIKEMLADVYRRFYSNDPNIILPFLQQWFFDYADRIYNSILKRSNYVLLQPERIFLMEKAPHAYTNPLKMYFAHHCDQHKNKHCL